MKKKILLAIETSCDETAAAVVASHINTDGEVKRVDVLSDQIASQAQIHAKTGGVVPEVAAREHITAIRPLLQTVMQGADIEGKNLDGIAVTVGPGLMPALSVGVAAARTLSYAWDVPLVPVHHIEGHIYATLLYSKNTNSVHKRTYQKPDQSVFPALALIVSGGHTLFIEVQGHLVYRIVGSTIDDAAGEAFDKVARMLDMPYPGGKHIQEAAQQGDKQAFTFPRPMMKSHDANVSFSGLKTAVLYAIQKQQLPISSHVKADIAAGFQEAVVDTLARKTAALLASKKYRTLLLSGGVAANAALRDRITREAKTKRVELRISPLELCGDNAVMIGLAGAHAQYAGRTVSWRDVDAQASVSIEEYARGEKTG